MLVNVRKAMGSKSFSPNMRFAGFASVLPALILFPMVQQTGAKKPAVKPKAKPTTAAVKTDTAPTNPKAPLDFGGLKNFVQVIPDTTVKINMVAIPAGTVTIDGKPVQIKPFYIADTETPWEAFDAFIASGAPSPAYDQTKFAADAIARPSKSYILPDLGWGHHGYPAINVSFLSTEMYCRWLSSKTGKKYRVPTEAEWEFACRAGATGPVKFTPAQLNKIAWTVANADKTTNPVGKKLPNAWKLYDMYGNVGEWATDEKGESVLCGGTFKEGAALQTPGNRKRWSPKWQETDPQLPKSRWWLSDGMFVGFRVVCEQ